MPKRLVWYGLGLIIGAGLAYGAWFIWGNYRGVGPVIKKPPVDISEVINTTGMPLSLPAGFSISIFADELPGARVVRFDRNGELWVSQTNQGRLTSIKMDSGREASRVVRFADLDKPHGFVFDFSNPDVIYIAEEGRVVRSSLTNPSKRETLMTMSMDGGHFTRTLGFGPDGKIYVTIGSSCNICREDNTKRASMWVMDRDGKNQRRFATGLRNTVFFTWRGNEIWGTEMGRDLLGDNTPPDEINIIKDGEDYGWPFCYGQRIQDKKFDSSSTAAQHCRSSDSSTINLPAHSAPLGLAFIPDYTSWPEDYRGNLIVAYHGSWNRSVPTGYKLVRFPFQNGNPQPAQDFISGWLVKAGAIGRPVDVVFYQDALYVSDDKAGVIYKIEYQQPAPATGTCRPTGCSGQVCSDQEMATDCQYKEEYACYQNARCERQADGQCGWTMTAELEQCLATKK